MNSDIFPLPFSRVHEFPYTNGSLNIIFARCLLEYYILPSNIKGDLITEFSLVLADVLRIQQESTHSRYRWQWAVARFLARITSDDRQCSRWDGPGHWTRQATKEWPRDCVSGHWCRAPFEIPQWYDWWRMVIAMELSISISSDWKFCSRSKLWKHSVGLRWRLLWAAVSPIWTWIACATPAATEVDIHLAHSRRSSFGSYSHSGEASWGAIVRVWLVFIY